MKQFFLKTLMVASAGILVACGNTEKPEDTHEDTAEDTSWSDIEEAGKIVVGTEGTYAPITYTDENNNLTGYDVELFREIAEYLNIEVEFKTSSFDTILPALRNGQIDVAANDMSITDEREDIFDFTIPYKYSYGSAIIRKEDKDKYHSAHDLEGKNVALGSLTSNYAKFAESVGANGSAYDAGNEAAVRDVLNGNQDAVLNDYLVLTQLLKEFGSEGSQLMIADQVKYHANSSAFPVLKGNKALVDKLNEAIKALTDDGTIARLGEEFLGADVSQPIDETEVVNLDGE